jgi:hypothetical protein
MIPKPNRPCVPVGTLRIASYKDGDRMIQMPLVSKFLCYLEAEARRELAGTPFCAIPFFVPSRRWVSGAERELDKSIKPLEEDR